MAAIVRSRWLVRASVAIGAFFAMSVVLSLVGSTSLATHGPPHVCQSMAITAISLQATNGDDNNLTGTVGADVVALGTGNDSSFLGAGKDYLCGNEDNDLNLNGGTNNDVINGGSGNDGITGDAGNDTIYAGTGDDLALGDTEPDYIEGNLGQDDLGGKDGNDTVKGNEDPDEVFDGRGTDTVQGNAPTTAPGDIVYLCDTGNTVSGFEITFGPNDGYC